MENEIKSSSKVGIVVVLLIIFAAGGFYGGTVYAKGKKGSFTAGRGGQMGQFGGNVSLPAGQAGGVAGGARGARAGGGFIAGEVLSKDAQTLTIKLPDGGSKIILLSDKTEVVKTTTTTLDDLTVGANLMITSTTNDDGSLTAQNIQLRPAGLPVGGGGEADKK